MPVEIIEASIASIPQREGALRVVVRSLIEQVDVLRVFLNGYEQVPDFLEQDRIVVARSQDHGDHGDVGKFFWEGTPGTVQLRCDDDILYPADYCEVMLSKLAKYQGGAVVGVHGVMLKEEFWKYYRDRDVSHFAFELRNDTQCHLLGTGTVAYHADTLMPCSEDFPTRNMADIYLGRFCQRHHVPMLAVARPHQWLRPIETEGPAIYDSAKQDDSVQSATVRGAMPWVLHPLRGKD